MSTKMVHLTKGEYKNNIIKVGVVATSPKKYFPETPVLAVMKQLLEAELIVTGNKATCPFIPQK